MMGLSDGRKSFRIVLAVLIQYRSVTDTQPPSQPASHVAVAITLHAQASSLKTRQKLQAVVSTSMAIFVIFSKHHQHAFKIDLPIKLSSSLRFCLLYSLFCFTFAILSHSRKIVRERERQRQTGRPLFLH